MISDDEARQRIRKKLDVSFAVDAGAGTGKTTLLIDRLAGVLLEKRVPLSRVAAITFTDKAAGELIERLRIKLEKVFDDPAIDPQLIRRALQDLEQASVSTIHSFCSSILREYPVEAGVDPRFAVLDQVQADALEIQAWEGWLKKSLEKEVETLSRFLKLGGTFNQVESLKDNLLKNRSLLTRPAPSDLPDPKPVLREISVFQQKIPTLLKQCKDQDDPMFQNLSAFLTQWESFKGTTDSVEIARLELPSSKSGAEARWEKGVIKPLKAELKQLEESHGDFAAKVKDSALLSLVNWLWDYLGEYQTAKTRQGFLDFDDLLSKVHQLLKNNPAVREELKKRYDRVFVDEFQDTDPLQVEIAFFLSERKTGRAVQWQEVKLEPGKLFIVGDPQQSIYRFRRADVEIYQEAKQKLEASGGRVEKLTENFRTLSPILEWVNQGFQKHFEGGLFPYVSQQAHRPAAKGGITPLVALEMAELPEDSKADDFRKLEAETVASFIAQLLSEKPMIEDPRTKVERQLRAGDIAVLFRDLSNTEEVYEEALRSRGVPFSVVGGKKFYNRPEIVALETLLSALESPADEAGLVALLRTSLFGFSDEELFLYREKWGKFQFLQPADGKMGEAFSKLREWREAIREKSPAEALLYLYQATNLLAVVASQTHGTQRVANLLKVVDQCRDLEASQNFTYRAFVKWLSRQREEDSMEGEAPGPEETGNPSTGSGQGQVTLMTLHKAKGLEFPVVILSSAGKDAEKPKLSSFIVNRAKGSAAFKVGDAKNEFWTAAFPKAQDEEKKHETAETLRLLYVGCTRAQESLVIPRFTQEKAPGFLRPLWKHLDSAGVKAMKVTMEKGEEVSPLVLHLDKSQFKGEAVEKKAHELKRLQEEKINCIRARTPVPAFKSVTSIVHADDDKSVREGWNLSGGPEEEPLSPSQEQAKAFGVLVHKLLEKGWDWDAALLEKAALAWALDLGLPEEKAKEAAQMAAQTLENPLLQRARRAPKIFRELPLTGRMADGKLLNAILDLAFLEGEEWVVVDYKTDKDMEKEKEKYGLQLGYYAELLTRFTGRSVKEKFLYFLRPGKGVVKIGP
jgi:ATP-dependent helicase/nuclease subunit A